MKRERGIDPRDKARLLASALLLGAVLAVPAHASTDPWADRVRSFEPGRNAGFGQERMPRVVLGPPDGAGGLRGSSDVVSLGHGGTITLAFRDNLLFDGPGPDLVVFENAFHVGSADGPVFTELAYVEISPDGRSWYELPADPASGAGLAGRTPVYASRDNGLDPLEPAAGGDRFDIADAPFVFVRYVRVTDVGDDIDDLGNHVPVANKAGFDLDAVAALHSVRPAVVLGTVAKQGLAVARARVKLVPADGSRKQWRRSRANGSFRFARVLPTGAYTLHARKRRLGKAQATVYLDFRQMKASVALVLH